MGPEALQSVFTWKYIQVKIININTAWYVSLIQSMLSAALHTYLSYTEYSAVFNVPASHVRGPCFESRRLHSSPSLKSSDCVNQHYKSAFAFNL